jgi:hypothetical protein
MGQKRNRKSREEMLAFRLAQVEKLQAQIEGSYQDDSDGGVLKQLKKRLRATLTSLKGAGYTLNGVVREDGKGYSRSPIETKIAKTEARLESQIETKVRAEVMVAKLPFDVETLEATIAAAKAGEEVEFPEGLTPLGKPETDEEHETSFIAKEEEAQQEV